MEKIDRILGTKWMISLLFVSLFTIFFTKSEHKYDWTKNNGKKETPIISDGSGYYAHLPIWFLYHNSGHTYSEILVKRYPNANFVFKDYNRKDIPIQNKFYTGTAVCLIPFFSIGHVHTYFAGEYQDGYSWPYLFWMNIGVVFYAVLGCIALFLVLRKLKLSYFAIYITLIGLSFGTNFSFYAYAEIPYSHVFSFCVLNWLVYFFLLWKDDKQKKHLYWVAFLFGLSFIIRPTNGLILLVLPFFFETNKTFLNQTIGYLKNMKIVVVSFIFILIPISIQVLSTYLQNGSIGFNGYQDEGFSNWKSPYFFEVLFGFRKGMFIYSPFLLLLIPGFLVLFLRTRRLFWGVFLFFIISIYVISSWWCWWYGGSLGMRATIDFYGVFAIPIAFLIHYAGKFGKMLLLSGMILSIFIYQRFEWQYQYKIIHYDYMNFNMFSDVFMKTDERYRFCFYSDRDTIPQNSKPITELLQFRSHADKENNLNYQVNSKTFQENKLESWIGLKVRSDVQLKTKKSNPTLYSYFYKNGVLIQENKVYIGFLPKQVGRYEAIEIDLTPDLKWKEVDSIYSVIGYDKSYEIIKNSSIQYYELN